MIISMYSVRASVLNARNKMVPREIARKVSKQLDIGDWWLIYMLGRNLDPVVFKEVLIQLSERLDRILENKSID